MQCSCLQSSKGHRVGGRLIWYIIFMAVCPRLRDCLIWSSLRMCGPGLCWAEELLPRVYKHLTVICAQQHQEQHERHFPLLVLSLSMHLEEYVLLYRQTAYLPDSEWDLGSAKKTNDHWETTWCHTFVFFLIKTFLAKAWHSSFVCLVCIWEMHLNLYFNIKSFNIK